jgi:hypothetical protein
MNIAETQGVGLISAYDSRDTSTQPYCGARLQIQMCIIWVIVFFWHLFRRILVLVTSATLNPRKTGVWKWPWASCTWHHHLNILEQPFATSFSEKCPTTTRLSFFHQSSFLTFFIYCSHATSTSQYCGQLPSIDLYPLVIRHSYG